NVRIAAVGDGNLLVRAGQEEQVAIARYLQDPARAIVTEFMQLPAGEPERLADTLRRMLGSPKDGGPFIEADSARNGLLVRGTKEQIIEIMTIVRAGSQSPSGKVRPIDVERGDAAALAEELERLLREMRPKDLDVRVTVPGKKGSAQPKNPKKDGAKGEK